MSLYTGTWDLRSYVFTTNVGMRPAEPCTISVVATHQVLTNILLSLMRQVLCLLCGVCSTSVAVERIFLPNQVQIRNLEEVTGHPFLPDDFFHLEEQNRYDIRNEMRGHWISEARRICRQNIEALEQIVGFKCDGSKEPTETSKELRKQGTYWGRHVLEVPIAWIL